eukprot:m.20429 g.20429  ORF g.20429 m.20429 type:complete len:150 (+) comp31971_c0_seq1:72-521(+)
MGGYYEVVYDDGDQYKGDWSADGKREGLGIVIFADGTRYNGAFVGGLCAGLGVLTFSDNSKYEGEFKNGKYHGFGVYTRADGMKYEGTFLDGQAQGKGLLTFADGSHGRPRQEGTFDGHRLVSRGDASDAVRQAQEAASSAKTSASTRR